MKRTDQQALMHFAGDFATAMVKVKQGAETKGSNITLSQDECLAIVTALRVLIPQDRQGDSNG